MFDVEFFTLLLNDVTDAYWQAVTGQEFSYFKTLFPRDFMIRLIEVMGIDRDMEETLRVQDQNSMDNRQFNQFLTSKGLTEKQVARHKQGQADITILSGPHLGGFNQAISIPELIEKLFGFSSLCISNCYLAQNGLNPESANRDLTDTNEECGLKGPVN